MTSPVWTPPTEFRDQCLELYGLTCPPQWGSPRRPHYKTFGGKVAQIADRLGSPLMPWQRYVADVSLEVEPTTGFFAYREVDLSVMRQQGKTTLVLPVTLHRLIAFVRYNVVYAAQTRNAARKKWEDEFVETLSISPLFGRFRIRKRGGAEAIISPLTRSKMGITANTESAGHGETLDLGFIDEAFSHEDDRLEQAFNPAMLTRPNAQKWVMSAGGTEKSTYWNRKRKTGRAAIEELWRSGVFPSIAYFEWFGADHLDRADPATWWGCMPALGHTVTEATIRSELETMGPAEFDRAYLNRTKKYVPPADPNVPTAEWPLRAVRDAIAPRTVALGIDITPNRDHASISAYGLADDGVGHVELITNRAGIDWIIPALLQLKMRRKPIAIGLDSKGPSATLLDDMIRAGLTPPDDPDEPLRGDLAVATFKDAVTAVAGFVDAVRQDRMRHIDQPVMNLALAGAQTRTPGEGGFLWARKTATADISPIVSGTFAKWAFENRIDKVSNPYDPLANIH